MFRSRSRVSCFLLLLLAFVLFASLVYGQESDEDAAAAAAAEAAAEEAAAAAVGEAADDEDDDDADALDEDADAARPDFERRHPLSELPPPSDDVHIGHLFTSGPAGGEKTDASLLTLGEPVRALIALRNKARQRVHVWGVMGSLNWATKFSIYVQNFTYGMVNKTVTSGDEMSFNYEFTPNERLDTRSFQLAVTVFYEMRSGSGNAIRGHSTTFFNSTVDTKPGPESMSNGLFVAIMLVTIAAVVGAYVVLFRSDEEKKNAKGGDEAAPKKTSKNEWLEDHHAITRSQGGRAKKRASGKS